MAAPGSVSIWLDPHIVTARVELWDQSYGRDIFVGVLIKPGWQGGDPYYEPYYMPGDPIPNDYYLYTIKFPDQTIDGITYQATELGFNFTFASDHIYTIPIQALATITIYVNKSSGKIGESFTFSGTLMQGDNPIYNEIVNLVLEGVGIVDFALTDIDGTYLISWIADRSGNMTFYANSPNV